MKTELKGILSAVLTPFDRSSGAIDEGAYAALIKSQAAAGIHGGECVTVKHRGKCPLVGSR